MQKTQTTLPEITLVGLSVRTNNASEATLESAKISPTIHQFFSENLGEKIQNRKNPGVFFSAYTNYESDFTGDYTYFFGQEVTSVDQIPEGLEALTVPAQHYAKFTNEPGPIPQVIIDMWQKIWKMDSTDFGGERAYQADFQVHDERSQNPHNAVLDIYVGIKE